MLCPDNECSDKDAYVCITCGKLIHENATQCRTCRTKSETPQKNTDTLNVLDKSEKRNSM